MPAPGSGETPVRFRPGVLEAIRSHALAEAPRECCGVLAGRDGEVTVAVPLGNVRQSPVRYEMDPAEQIRVQKALRRDGLARVGYYHSHPATEPVPSATDVALAADRAAVYLIVSPALAGGPWARLWRIRDRGVAEVPIAVG